MIIENLIPESDGKKCYIRQGDKTWPISTFKAKGKYWFFADEIIRILGISDVMLLKKYAGEDNANLQRVKLPGEQRTDYPLINEDGMVDLITYVNRQNRFIFDFLDSDSLIEYQKLFEEYIEKVGKKYEKNIRS